MTDLLKSLKARLIQYAFKKKIAAYTQKRLSREFGSLRLATPLSQKPGVHVYKAESSNGPVIVKFYNSHKRDLAMNCVLTSEAFTKADVPHCPIVKADISDIVLKEFGMNCLIFHCLGGVAFHPLAHQALAGPLATALGRLHADMADTFGRFMAPARGNFKKDFALPTLQKKVKILGRRHSGKAAESFAAMGRWMTNHCPDFHFIESQYSALHGDLLYQNILVDAKGDFKFIDLDRGLRAAYGMELGQAILKVIPPRFSPGPIECWNDDMTSDMSAVRDFEATYFAQTPPSFRDDWSANRQWYLTWAMLFGLAADLHKGFGP